MTAENRVVATFRNEMEAVVARGLLETAGIAAFVVKDDGGGMVPSLQRWRGVQLLVAAPDWVRACEILAANSLSEGES